MPSCARMPECRCRTQETPGYFCLNQSDKNSQNKIARRFPTVGLLDLLVFELTVWMNSRSTKVPVVIVQTELN